MVRTVGNNNLFPIYPSNNSKWVLKIYGKLISTVFVIVLKLVSSYPV